MATIQLDASALERGPQSVPVKDPVTGEESTVSVLPLGAGGEVGRSCIVVSHKGSTVMFDCGVHPAKSGIDSLPLFDSADMSRVDLCLVTHFHLDHCGAVPYLCESTAFAGRIFMTPPTRSFYRLVMEDFLRVGSSGQDIVSRESLHQTMPRIETVDYHEEKRHKGVRFQALNAGHVLGAAMFLADIAGVRVLYTGDYSRVPDRHLLGAELPPVAPDILIVEATYGIQVHETREERERMFTSWVRDIVLNGGRCLIPVFALGRAQELLLILEEFWAEHRELQHVPIHYASSLATKCMQLYRTSASAMNHRVRKQLDDSVDPFDFKFIQSLSDLSAFDDSGPSVVLASPGMLQSGISLDLFERWCGERRNGLIVAGYCVEETVARNVLKGKRTIERPGGRTMTVRMNHIHEVSFSAHSDARQTTEFIEALEETTQVVLVHGNADSISKLSKRLEDRFEDRGLVAHCSERGPKEIRIPFVARRSARLLGTIAQRASDALGPEREGQAAAVEGVLLVSDDQQHTLVDPKQLADFTALRTARVDHATVVTLPMFVQPRAVLEMLCSYFASSRLVPIAEGKKPIDPTIVDVASDDDDAAGKTVIAVTAGVNVEVRQHRRGETTAVVLWQASRFADIVADVATTAISQLLDVELANELVGGSAAAAGPGAALAAVPWHRHPMATRDRAFRLRCWQRTLAQQFNCVRVNLTSGVGVFNLPVGGAGHGVWVKVADWLRITVLSSPPADDDTLAGDEEADAQQSACQVQDGATEVPPAALALLQNTLRRIYLALNPLPADAMDIDAVQPGSTGVAELVLDGGGWCECGQAH